MQNHLCMIIGVNNFDVHKALIINQSIKTMHVFACDWANKIIITSEKDLDDISC